MSHQHKYSIRVVVKDSEGTIHDIFQRDWIESTVHEAIEDMLWLIRGYDNGNS